MTVSTRPQSYFEISPKLEGDSDLDHAISRLEREMEFTPPLERPVTAEDEQAPCDLELQATLETISRARGDVEALLSRNQMLETYVVEVECKARSEVKDARDEAETWTARALDAETAVAGLERALSDAEARAEAAEQELQRGKQALILLHDAIAAAFGYGSVLHDRLQSADPNVPGLGVVRDKVVQLAIQMERPEALAQPRITHRAA